MKMTWKHLILLFALAVVIVPVSADAGNTSNITAVPTTNATTLMTTVATPISTEVTTTTVAANATTTVPATTTSAVTTTTQTTISATTATTVVTTIPSTPATSGDISVASSPLGAAILVDGVYYGTTPGNVTGLAYGNHIIRLALSGYTDYEGTFYVVAGQRTPVYGTLQPISIGSSQIIVATASLPAITPVPVTPLESTTSPSSSGSAFENPTVIAAIIGIVTACIGAGATIFTHNANIKKLENEKKP